MGWAGWGGVGWGEDSEPPKSLMDYIYIYYINMVLQKQAQHVPTPRKRHPIEVYNCLHGESDAGTYIQMPPNQRTQLFSYRENIRHFDWLTWLGVDEVTPYESLVAFSGDP